MKSRDSTYSVTNMSVSENDPMFSPDDSPASSVDSSDLLAFSQAGHVTNFSSHRLKITLPEEESMDYDLKQNVTMKQNSDKPVCESSTTQELFHDQNSHETVKSNSNMNPFMAHECTSSDKQPDGVTAGLKTFATLPFQPSSQLDEICSQSENSLDVPASETEVDSVKCLPNSTQGLDSVAKRLGNSHSESESVSSTVVVNNELLSRSCVSSASEQLSTECSLSLDTQANNNTSSSKQTVTSSSSSQPLCCSSSGGGGNTTSDVIHSVNTVNSSATITSTGTTSPLVNHVLTSLSVSSTSVSTNSVSNSTPEPLSQTETVSVNLDSETKSDSSCEPEAGLDTTHPHQQPCSPRAEGRDSQQAHSSHISTPKVPPLKIIIPPKSQPSSTTPDVQQNDRLKLVVTNVKSALPYVINPYQGPSGQNLGQGQPESSSDLEQGQSLLQMVSSSQPLSNHVSTNNNLDVCLTTSDSLSLTSSKGRNCDGNGFLSSKSVCVASTCGSSENDESVSACIPMDVDSNEAATTSNSVVDNGVTSVSASFPGEVPRGAPQADDGNDDDDEVSDSVRGDTEGQHSEGQRGDVGRKGEAPQRVLRSTVRSQQPSIPEMKLNRPTPSSTKTADKNSDRTSEKSDKNSKCPRLYFSLCF